MEIQQESNNLYNYMQVLDDLKDLLRQKRIKFKEIFKLINIQINK